MNAQDSNDNQHADRTGRDEREDTPSMDVDNPANEGAAGSGPVDTPVHEAEEVEPEGLNAAFILKVGGISVVVLIVVVQLIMQFINLERQQQEFAMAEQADFIEQRRLNLQALEQLESYGTVGENDTVYHVPIGQAIEYVANERYGAPADTAAAAE